MMVQIVISGVITDTTPDIMLVLAVTTPLVVVVLVGGGGGGACHSVFWSGSFSRLSLCGLVVRACSA